MAGNRANTRKWVVLIFVLAGLLYVTALPLGAAYRVERPITQDGGRYDQGFLWGQPLQGLDPHRGLDFPYPVNTPVFTIADGTMVRYYDGDQNGQGTGFGNYVLLRHDRQSWDRTLGANSYVYSIYAHLAFHSVQPAGHVAAGTHIADVDNTGNSTGNHLHLQICLHPAADWDMTGTEDLSRNPELWLRPYQDTTGTVIGKWTDAGGSPIGDLHEVRGLGKPYGNYECNVTYSYDWAHPDDILVENWGTTDVTAGTYSPGLNGLRICEQSTPLNDICTDDRNCVPYGDYSQYTVAAGQVTYVNLYPFSLPEVRSSVGYVSYAGVRNNSTSDTAAENATWFDSTATGQGADSDLIPPRGMRVLAPHWGTWLGSGVVVNSERSAVAVMPQNNDNIYAYTAAPVSSSLGLAQATTLYMPNFLNGYNGWYSLISFQNSGRMPTNVLVTYYDTSGTQRCQQLLWNVQPLERRELKPQDCAGLLPATGAVHLSTAGHGDQPLAAITVQYLQSAAGETGRSAYNAFSDGSGSLYAPSLFRNYYGWTSRMWIHNPLATTANVAISYYKRDGTFICANSFSLAGHATRDLFQGSTDAMHTCLWNYNPPEVDRTFSASLIASGKIVAVVNHESIATMGDYRSYNAFIQGRRTLVFPWIAYSTTGARFQTEVVIQNTTNNWNNVNIYWYDHDGIQRGNVSSNLPAHSQWKYAITSPNLFEGSAVVESEQPVAAVANLLRVDLFRDAGASYGGVGK